MKGGTGKYSGVIVPAITPVNRDMSLDGDSFAGLMKTFTKNRLSVFLLGTTGESTSVAEADRTRLVELAMKYRSEEISVFAGIPANSMADAIRTARLYADLGVDAVVSHLPFYYPISVDRIADYFEEIADNSTCPVILYNNPATVRQSIPVEIADKLSHHRNIAGLKDSERGIERLNMSLELWKDRDDFDFLLGWAAQSAYALVNGARGIVPSTANLTPKLYRELYDAAVSGNAEMAEMYQVLTDRVSEVNQAGRLINESIPALKVIMSVYGLCKPFVLPPMYMPGDTAREELTHAISKLMGDNRIEV